MALVLDTGPILAALDADDPHHAACAALEEAYADLSLGFVDASVIAVCERLREDKLATLDHRHFGTVRPAHCDAFRLLPQRS